MKIEYYEEMLEEEAINKYLNMIANDYNGELARIFEEKYINKDKEIDRLNSKVEELMTLYTTEREVKEDYKTIIKEVREILLCYGETFDLKVHQQMQKELLEILDKVGDEK